MTKAFSDSLSHVLAELSRIDSRLRSEIESVRSANVRPDEDGFCGLYLSEAEIDGILSDSSQSSTNLASPTGTPDVAPIARLDAEISEKKAESQRKGFRLRLVEMSVLFGLSRFDTDVILLCLLPELDLKYEKLCAYLQDDVTRKRPTVGLALRLFCNSFAERLAARDAFSPNAPLLRYNLVALAQSPGGDSSLLARPLKCDDRIMSYLLGSDEIDARLLPFARLVKTESNLVDVVLPAETKRRLTRLARKEGGRMALHFYGPQGAGKHTTAEALCAELKLPLLIVDLSRLLASEPPFETTIRLLSREAKLAGCALYWDGFDALLTQEKRPQLDALLRESAEWPGLSFLAGEIAWAAPEAMQGVSLFHVAFPVPSCQERERLWKVSLNGHLQTVREVDLAELSSKFKLTGGQIRNAVADARNRARWRASERLSLEDMRTACQAQSNQKLGALAIKVESRYRWTDLVLPPEQLAQLEDITRAVKYRQLVYGDWRFGDKLSLGKGLSVLFAGPSGTGKTMAAGIIAGELKLDIYKIDLASVVSKYIGETEKNLSRIFTEAETSNAILSFDEADALFGKRSEVKDSHDRYANIEIGYLLQKMEEYEGMVILATNLRQNMDDAFVRRMQFIVEFPYPEEEYRYRIWKGIFPSQAPVDGSVDYEFLARQFKVAGGNIKNIALSAAFLAADDGKTITMKHVARAARREFNKMGKLCVESDFGKYYALVAGD